MLARGNCRINLLAPMRLQRLKGRDLVYAHQTAVADDIGGKDCCEAASGTYSGIPARR